MNIKFSLIESFRKTTILQKYNEIQHYETLNREQIADEQKRRLAVLLLYVKKNNPFYGKLLKIFSDSEIQNEPVIILQTLPLADKEFLNANYNEIFVQDTGKSIQQKQTGGSTGTPFKYFINKDSISHTWAFVYRFWNKYAGYNFGDPYTTVAGNSLHSHGKKLFEFFYYFLQSNYLVKGDIISGDMQFDYNRLNKSMLVYGYPSSINLLLKYYPGLFADSHDLKAIFTTSELLIPQVRDSIEKASGKKVFDMYGANDGGIVSSECHCHNGYHYNMLSCYPESIDFQGQHELVLTNFFNFNFPFIRYRVGDLGRIVTEPCSCGNPFDRITDLKGRTRDLIYLKNNKVFHGSLLNSLMFRYPEIKLYKVVQRKDYSIELKIMVKPEDQFPEIAEKIMLPVSDLMDELSIKIEKLEETESSDKKFKIIESFVN
jgi:phenylacetate-CoA ligase